MIWIVPSPSPQPLPIKSSRKTDICARVSITAFMDVRLHLISTNRRSSIPFFVLMGTVTGIETIAVTTSLINSSSVPLAVIMLLLALRGGVFLAFFGHSRAKCPTFLQIKHLGIKLLIGHSRNKCPIFSQIKHLGLKPLLVPVFDSIGNLAFQKNGAFFGRRQAPLLSETNLLFVDLYLVSFEWAPLTLALTLSYSSSLSARSPGTIN
ncbi:hypothetical protein TNCV_1768901 [Trichonephila clavipes]|nr:hypothetical protein TNCV_1768901 [Trichonephila clavipes]